MKIWIHHWPSIDWHRHRVEQLQRGLVALGFEPQLTSLRTRIDESPAVLLGTTFWHAIEADPLPSLLVDRASWGDPDQVQLSWNGRLRRGDHCVPEDWQSRPSRLGDLELQLQPLRHGDRTLLCGQVTPNGAGVHLEDWLSMRAADATHYKPHPATLSARRAGRALYTPEGLPITTDWLNAGALITLNSSVAVWGLINGYDSIADDPGAMIYPYSRGDLSLRECLEWIAWTQWSWAEIEAGEPIRHIFNGENRGLRTNQNQAGRDESGHGQKAD